MLPIDFIESLHSQLSHAEVQQLCQALESEPIVSIRLNDKIDCLTFDADTEEVPWHEDGYYLSQRPQFTLDPLFHAGCYYVQEASSMFLGEVLNQYVKKNSIVLDMCAAPGGKSTLISQYLGDEGLLVSNEVVRQRVFILSENIQKWGNGNTVVTHNYAADFGNKLENLFDCILVDAPCSGEGMFRKDAGAVEEWSLKNVHECVSRQCEILDEVWDALKPGGVLIYSTCTFNQEENEKNAKWIMEELGAELLPIAHDPSWGIVEGNPGYHFYPHKLKGEGLYMCAFRKNGAYGTSFRIPKSKAPVTKNKVDGEAEMRSWLKHPDRWVIRQQERFMSAYPAKYKELIEYISTQFICISTGFGIGELRGKNVTPQHSLAMLKDINADKFTRVDLTQEQALAYLRNEALVLPNVAQGIVLVTYEQVPLGFVKNVGNHCNNLYPKEWRIRKL
ncbi:MAG: rRNA cytosine-C5-methyltransferase [Paludibacteraceae bacterium]|nr:rRNA cytosine-C5-methyltransferase [Paludibacteraceae bacterium]